MFINNLVIDEEVNNVKKTLSVTGNVFMEQPTIFTENLNVIIARNKLIIDELCLVAQDIYESGISLTILYSEEFN